MNATAAEVQATVVTRFIDNGDGTVTDTRLGLMWSKDTLNTRGVGHEKAGNLCAELELAGHADWRLPTVEELFLLADRTRKEPAIDTAMFPDTKSDWYWTSTDSAWASSYAWVVFFYYGGSLSGHRRGSFGFVRAVRSLPAGQ